ncbi:hypothetical protein NBRC116188_27180 [Oceaniserpentilla sp. 4NH20-0058]|uniref:DUF4402 domain-containing protein n=1 Tax=Oceaniserpentilla sp. 4NH20-0058 TaxID=3127660 RepID=UPI0031085920
MIALPNIIKNSVMAICFLFPLFNYAAPKLKTITISEVTAIDFGTISSENGICTMQSGGNLLGSSGQTCSGIQTPGEFDIRATNGEFMNLSVQGGSTQGLTFRPQIDGPSLITLSGGANTVVIIGELELLNVNQGSFNIPYTFSANYE